MKMTKNLIIASVVLPLVLSTGSALAFGGKDKQGHKGSPNECRVGLDRGMMKILSLTDEQKEQFKTLRRATKEERKDRTKTEQQRTERLAGLDKINTLLLADEFDIAKANEIAQEMAQKHIKRQVTMLNHQYQMMSILTPEQKVTLTELQKERLTDCAEDMSERHEK